MFKFQLLTSFLFFFSLDCYIYLHSGAVTCSDNFLTQDVNHGGLYSLGNDTDSGTHIIKKKRTLTSLKTSAKDCFKPKENLKYCWVD